MQTTAPYSRRAQQPDAGPGPRLNQTQMQLLVAWLLRNAAG
ncbi:MAG: hypothetical protein OXU96_03400 [Gammaproteobacteria bacterium]|nr:hypothetical protein [Gammaproteobacteria bacterium]